MTLRSISGDIRGFQEVFRRFQGFQRLFMDLQGSQEDSGRFWEAPEAFSGSHKDSNGISE